MPDTLFKTNYPPAIYLGTLTVKNLRVGDTIVWPSTYWTKLTFDDIANVPVADASDVSAWNTWFDLPTNGTPFTSVSVDGAEVILFGGGKITLKDYLFGDDPCGPHLISIIDSGCIIDPGEGTFSDYGTNAYGCYNMTTAVLPAIRTLNLWPLYSAKKLTSFVIPEGITIIDDYCFSFCEALTSIIIPDTVETIGECGVSACFSLPSLVIPDSIEIIGLHAFEWSTALTSLTLGNGLKILDNGAFYYCPLLTNVTIPDSVESIGEIAFADCEGLASVTIGTGVISIGVKAFDNCYLLKTVNMNPLTAPTVSVTDSFPDSGATLHIPAGATGYDVAPWTNTAKFASIVQDL